MIVVYLVESDIAFWDFDIVVEFIFLLFLFFMLAQVLDLTALMHADVDIRIVNDFSHFTKMKLC